MLKRIIAVTTIAGLVLPQLLLAAEFNPNYIISDEDLTNYKSMSKDKVQQFFLRQTGVLKDYKVDVFGAKKTASDIIYDAAQFYKINPQYLIVLLQKEQSLVSDSSPSDSQINWATGYGVCDSCSKDDPRIQKYKGLYNQINWAAKRNRQYIDESGQWHYKVGGTYLIDGQTVTISNQATVNLYTYTPHLHGNEVFHRLWTKWFATNFPDGTLLQLKSGGGIYLIQNGKKRAFWSRSAFQASYSSRNVIQVDQTELDKYPDGFPIRFAEYSILQGPDGMKYLIVRGEKRLIESDEVFRQLGYHPEEVIEVEAKDLNSYPNADPITLNSIFPTGTLLQSKQTGGIIFVENGLKHPIWSKEILQSRFPKAKPTLVDESDLQKYASGDAVKFLEGELISAKGERSVYVVTNGEKRPIDSIDTFNQLGYQWKNIIWTSPRALEVHPTGPALTLE